MKFDVTCSLPFIPQPCVFISLLRDPPITQLFSNLPIVSSDVAITITFGLFGAIISLIGVVIACLTLRFMMIEKCMPHYSIMASVDASAGSLQMSGITESMETVMFFVMSIRTSSRCLKVKE
jgi:hypothetical protein